MQSKAAGLDGYIIVVLLIFFTVASCANPFGKGTWSPLPFKKMQKANTSSVTAIDTSQKKG